MPPTENNYFESCAAYYKTKAQLIFKILYFIFTHVTLLCRILPKLSHVHHCCLSVGLILLRVIISFSSLCSSEPHGSICCIITLSHWSFEMASSCGSTIRRVIPPTPPSVQNNSEVTAPQLEYGLMTPRWLKHHSGCEVGSFGVRALRYRKDARTRLTK